MTIQERLAWLHKETEALARMVHDSDDVNLAKLKGAITKVATEVHSLLTEIRQQLIERNQSAATE